MTNSRPKIDLLFIMADCNGDYEKAQRRIDHALEECWPDTHGLEARAGGLEKGAEIARYFRDMPLRNEAYKAACREIETSCLATAIRIRLGKPENPTSDVMQSEKVDSK